MSLVNIYLKETPLTSTKNKYLEEGLNTDIFKRNVSLKRTLEIELFSPKKCMTENRFLLNDPLFKKEDFGSVKKKKKKKAILPARENERINVRKYCMQSMSRSRPYENLHDCLARSVESDEMLDAPLTDTFLCAAVNSDTVDQLSVPKSMEKPASASFGGFAFGSANIMSTVPPAPFGAVGTKKPSPSRLTFVESHLMRSAYVGNAENLRFGAAPGGGFPLNFAENVPEKFISEMPTYNLEVINVYEEKEFEFTSRSSDSSQENIFANAQRKKMQLLNVISMALMFSSNLKNKEDNYRITLMKSIDDVISVEPEFILKVALYARQELQIRAVSNFLLSYAAAHQDTRIYLEKYFEASIVLPSDWIQVAEFYQIISCEPNKRSLPAALRRAMKKCFQKFDKYQLAKYNRVGSKKKQKIGAKSDDTSDNSNENEQPVINRALTLKILIQSLHIDSPSEHVMCLLEKKYPKSLTEFISCRLPGTWDPEKSGKRMKLPIPETWETRVSAEGNKPHVWESLIDNNKLPYMATLRNLRNLILSGISPAHHEKVISTLQNKKAVMKSRQLPMQYFEAYKVLTKLQKMIESNDSWERNITRRTPGWKKLQLKKMNDKLQNIPVSVVEKYKKAVSTALEISSMNNLHPIPGKTLIICHIEQVPGYPAKANSYETCVMMALMCLKACEDCKLCIFSSVKEMNVVSLENDQFLDALMKICEEYETLISNPYLDFGEVFYPAAEIHTMLNSYLRPQNMLSLKLDHLIFLKTSPENVEADIMSFLHKYRQLVNPDLLYTNVNFYLQNNSFSGEYISDKDAYVCGSSSSLIKFIAERSAGGQLFYVQNIDVKYNLPEISESKYSHLVQSEILDPTSAETSNNLTSSINYRLPKWHTLRIFISSTFKDMMSERDLLIRYVFPELKRRAASVFVKIVEIDLRWGITEADSSTKRAAEICLREAQKADIFVGIIGERYGTIYNFEPPDAEDLRWVKDCPSGLSITELEIYAAALQKTRKSHETAFFYFRNNSFMRHVPKKWLPYFAAEDSESKTKIESLKEKIRSKNFSILEGYPCHFAGICNDKPVLAGLDVLGKRVLDDLWKAVQEIQKMEPFSDSLAESEMHQQNFIQSKKFFIDQKNFSRESVTNKIVSKEGIFVIYGSAGCGKSTFLINLLPYLKKFTVVKFFIGVSPRSRDMSYIIQYLCKYTCHQLGASVSLPSLPADIVSYFPDFLLEISNCCGGREIIFLIDGLDHLEENDQRLDWLPFLLPKKIRMIFSTSQSSLAFKVLCEREKLGSTVSVIEMLPLLLPERGQIVRNYLSDYRKVLDENAFSNKMLKIVTKKDSSNPFYLRIVCDFLRIYGSFENLESMLQNLPSSIDLFYQEIMLQMENEFGSILIQTVLILLCITKEGLEDADLHYVLSFATFMNDLRAIPPYDELKKNIASLKPENLLCQIKYCSLMSTVSTFAYGQLRQEFFSLVGTEFEKAVKKFYRNKNLTILSKSLHCILAAYYDYICDVTNDGTYKVKSGSGLCNLLYHMLHGGLYKELVNLLCNVTFLKAVFLASADSDILEYYSSLLCDILPSDQKLSREIDYSRLVSFYDFISRNFHIFHQYPDLVIQQAINELSTLVDLKGNSSKCYLIENLTRVDIVDYRLATLSGFTKNITAAAGENSSDTVVLGTEDGYIKVLDLRARKVVRTIKAHASEITHICCIGRNRMCVSSVDGTLSLWDTEDFSRISVLHGHRHNVTCCCSDPDGFTLYSCGWDNVIRLWSTKDGRSITVIEGFTCPVNWIDHHPQKQQVACGLWNGNIEIWDTLSVQKKTVMSNLSGSVQSLAYTQDGINIISSYINSEISIWSSEEGLKMACLKGHVLPVKTLTSLLNENIIITGSDDCTLKLWSTACRSNFTTITDTKFCPIYLIELISENLLAVAFQNAEVWVFDINNGNVISKITLDSDMVSVFCKYSMNNPNLKGNEIYFREKNLIFGTQSGKLMLEDVMASSVSKALEFHSKITAAAHNCKIIVCGTSEGDIGMYHPDKKLFKTVFSAHKGFIGTFCFSEENEILYLLSSANDNVLKLWAVEWNDFELTLQNEFLNKHRDAITFSLIHSPLSSESLSSIFPISNYIPQHSTTCPLDNLLTGSYDNNVMLWEGDSVKIFEGLQSSVVKISCSNDYILGCGNDGALVIWHKNGSVLTTIPGIDQSSAVLAFHVATDDSGEFAVILAYVDLDGSIKIDKSLQMNYYCSLDGHNKPITSCCGTESREIVSCSLDGTVNLWKIPQDFSNGHFRHETYVTGVILSPSLDFALSSDAHGNLVFWKTDLKSSTSPLMYAGKKKYEQSFIKGLSWLTHNKFVCAVSQIVDGTEKNFLDIIELKDSTQKTVFCLEVIKSYTLESEVTCLDSCMQTGGVVVGLKSGNVMYITPEVEHCFKVCYDWILGICFFSKSKPSDRFCVSFIDGHVKMYSIQNLLSENDRLAEPFKTYEPPDSHESSKFTSAMCCAGTEFICCGDSDGTLRIYAQNFLKFVKKIHDDSISGICIIDSYLFTSSLDKTVKGWNLNSFKQMYQFHSNAPVSSLSSVQKGSGKSGQCSNILLIGTTSGTVHLLQFHSL